MVKKVANKYQEKIAELEEKYKRVLADYQNQERRHKEGQSQVIKMASATLIEKLLINLDSLELAQKHLQDKGLQMVIDQIFATLSQEGLTQIETDHLQFDPLLMDCTEVVSGEKDQVVETVSKGYYLYDNVLRPAKVKVGAGGNDFHPSESGDLSNSGSNFHPSESEDLSDISGEPIA